MCGLVGALAFGDYIEKRLERVRQESMIFLTTELLTLTQTRGKDATGVATMFADCDYMGLKMGISAQEFVSRFGKTEEDYEGYLNVWRKKVRPAKISIGHCRKPSVGGASGPENNNNNHPIKIGDIIGVHNGTLTNHEKIFANLACKRDGNVDSEAIFRLLHHYTNNGTEPFTPQAIQEVCKRISGSYAVMTFSGNNPFQMAAFRDGRPLEIAIIRPLKLVLIASDKDFLRMAVCRYNKMAHLYQTGLMKFIPLKMADVDFESLADDSLYLFDVRKEITAASKVSDLYITEKIPITGKIWLTTKGGSATPYNPNQNWNANNYNAAKKTEVKAEPAKQVGQGSMLPTIPTPTSPESGKLDQRSCMVWNRTSAQYESVATIDETQKHGNVEVNCDDGEVIDIITDEIIVSGSEKDGKKSIKAVSSSKEQPGQKFGFEETDNPVDDLITDPARISEIPVSTTNDESNDSHSKVEDPVIAIFKRDKTADPCNELPGSLNEKSAEVPEVKVTEVDLSTHPDVLEIATKVTRSQPNFSSDLELADALEITNLSAMQSMEMYSLANRIKAFIFKRGWYSGYVARLKEEGSFDENLGTRSILTRVQNKQRAAQDTIRNIKSINNIFWSMLGKCPEHPAWDETAVEDAVKDTLGKGKSLNLGVLEKAFKPGDLQEIPVLSTIMASVANKKSK